MIQFSLKILHSFVKTEIDVMVMDQMTVLELKNLIAEAQGINKDLQSVIFKGKVLKDDEELTKLGVHNKTVMVIHREPPCVDWEPSLLEVIEDILNNTDPPTNPTIDGNIYTERAFHDTYIWFMDMKSLMEMLCDITGDIIPHNLENMNLRSGHFRPHYDTKVYSTTYDENFQVTYFLQQLNLICQFLSPFLLHYRDIIHELETISNNEEKHMTLLTIKMIIIDLTHNIARAYHVLYNAKNKIDARENSQTASSTNHPGPSKATYDPSILDIELFNYVQPYLNRGLRQLAEPMDGVSVLDSTTSDDDDQDENESRVVLDSSDNNEATSALSSNSDAESNESSTNPKTNMKKDEDSP